MDDDDVVDHDDSAGEEPTPEEIVVPDGADPGVPGAFVGLRARTLDAEPVVSPPVEVGLADPAARSDEATLDPETRAAVDRSEAGLTPDARAAVRRFGAAVDARFEEVER